MTCPLPPCLENLQMSSIVYVAAAEPVFLSGATPSPSVRLSPKFVPLPLRALRCVRYKYIKVCINCPLVFKHHQSQSKNVNRSNQQHGGQFSSSHDGQGLGGPKAQGARDDRRSAILPELGEGSRQAPHGSDNADSASRPPGGGFLFLRYFVVVQVGKPLSLKYESENWLTDMCDIGLGFFEWPLWTS